MGEKFTLGVVLLVSPSVQEIPEAASARGSSVPTRGLCRACTRSGRSPPPPRAPPPRAVFWNWNTSNSFRTVPYYTLERIRDEPRRRWRSAGRRVNTAARAEQGGSNVFSCERHIEDEEHFALLPRLLLMRNSRRSFERAPIIYHRQSLASRAWRRLQWPTRSRRSV